MRPELTASSVVNQPKDQAGLHSRSPDRTHQIIPGRWRPADGDSGARQRHAKVVGNAGRYLEIFTGAASIWPKASVGQPREGTNEERIDPRAPIKKACRFRVWDGVSP